MTFADDIASDLAANQFNTADLAVTVTYAGSSIAAVVEYGENGPDSIMAVITVMVSDVAAPAYRDAVVISGNTWRVQQTISGDGHVWILSIMRGERVAEP